MLETSGKIAVKNEKANAKDLVTESDIQCQKLIEEILHQEFPDAHFLGEEDVDAGSDASQDALGEVLQKGNGLLFIVDPIDGTTNFQAGLPLFCASIGVVDLETQDIVAGVIYNPVLDEMSTAIKGKGAFFNGEPLRSDDEAAGTLPLSQSMVNVGFPVVKESTLRASSKAVTALSTRVRGLRMIACASQAMAWVAHDKLQVYTSWDLNAWDVAAGIVIVREAGGSIMDFDGKPATITSRDLVITSPSGREKLGNEVRKILEEAGCVVYD